MPYIYIRYPLQMEDYKGLLWGNTTSRPSPQPVAETCKITSYRQYRCFKNNIDESLRPYLDFYGQKFIPVTIGDHTYHVNSALTEEVCGELLAGKDPMLKPYEIIGNPPTLRFQEFYVGEIPKWLQVLFDMHGVKFAAFEKQHTRYHIYEKSFETICRKLCILNVGANAVTAPATITLEGASINLQDFYAHNSDWNHIGAYLSLLGIPVVTVAHSTGTYHVPVSQLAFVARRLNLYS